MILPCTTDKKQKNPVVNVQECAKKKEGWTGPKLVRNLMTHADSIEIQCKSHVDRGSCGRWVVRLLFHSA